MRLIPNSFGARLREHNDCHDKQTGEFCSKDSASRVEELKRVIKEPIGMTRKKPGLGRMDDPPSLSQQHDIRQRKIRRARAKIELARLLRQQAQETGGSAIKLTGAQLAALDGRGLSKHDRIHYEQDLTDEEKLVVSVWRDGKLHVTPENADKLASALTRLANDEDELAEDKTLPKHSRAWARASRAALSNLADKVWKMAPRR